MKNTIYQIVDNETLDYLLNTNNINHDNMVNLVEKQKINSGQWRGKNKSNY